MGTRAAVEPLCPERRSELLRVEAELARLSSGYGRARLRMGREFERLMKKSGHMELGFSSLAAYSYERCSLSGRWAADSRALARKLESLPVLTAALEAGRISWSKAELLARNATPENEAELLAEAQQMTTRALRDAMKGKGEEDEDEQRYMTLSISVPKEDEILLEATRILLMRFEGGARGDQWVEALLAEGQSSLVDRVPIGTDLVPDDVAGDHAAAVAARGDGDAWRRAAEARAEPRIERELAHEERDAADVEELSEDPYRLDKQLRSDAAELATRDQWMGMLAAKVLALGGWQALGYASEKQYCRERLGISRSSFRRKIQLARGTARFAELERALLNGTIGVEAALLLARVITPETEAAWVARAKERTFKHLRQEVDLVELVARVHGDRSPALPPDRDDIRAFEALESDILSGRTIRGALGTSREEVAGPAERPVSPDDAGAESVADGAAEPAVQISGGSDVPEGSVSPEVMPCGPQHAVRLRVREEIGLWFRALETSFERHGGPRERFIQFLCTAVWQSWVHVLGDTDQWDEVYARDGYRCRSPVCLSHECTCHHMTYRSHGGSDEMSNTITVCSSCHLHGEHEGRLQIRGRAEKATWILGRRPILVIEDRVKREPRRDDYL